MENVILNLEARTEVGGERPKRLRKSGYIPAVVYGQGMETVTTQIKASDFRGFLSKHGRTAVFTTEFAAEDNLSIRSSESLPVATSANVSTFSKANAFQAFENATQPKVETGSYLVKDIQYDPLRKGISHIDFQRVSLTEKVSNAVPVRVLGRERIEKDGNVIVHQLNEVIIECLPQDAPRYIDADVSGMTPGHSLTAGQLKLPVGAALVTDPLSNILSVTGGGLELKVHKEDEKSNPPFLT